jgi:hypothetical protein
LGEPARNVELICGNQSLAVRIDEMVHDLELRSFGPAQAFSKHRPVAIESVRDLPRARSDRATQSIRVLVVAAEIRREQEQIDAQIQLVRQLPGGGFGDITGGRHTVASSNRAARTTSANSGVISNCGDPRIADTATRIGDRH